MFYCEDCRVKNGWPEGFMMSHGPCELCETVTGCHDVPSSALPVVEGDASGLVTVDTSAETRELPDETAEPQVGQWYWIDEKSKREKKWFACIVEIGSNYVKVESPGGSYTRIHFDEFDDRCRLEPDPDTYIDKKIRHYQDKTLRLMNKVKELTARLGVAPAHGELTAGGETAALVRVNNSDSFDRYSKDLVKAKEKTLPDLFEKIKSSNKKSAMWMSAKVVPLRAQAGGMKSIVDKIDDRIFSVELYAGLTEHVELIHDGEAAELGTKVHLLQRRLYMDEECLARYETGGMDYKNIAEFDRWLVRPDNLDRLLPFGRCVVTFQVRRNSKERDAVDLRAFLRILKEEKADKWTFMYIRNGEKVYRMHTAVEFGTKLFPDLDQSDLDGHELRARRRVGWEIITEEEYQALCDDYDRRKAEWRQKLDTYEAAIRSPEAKRRARELGKSEPDATCVDVPWTSDWWSDFDDPRGGNRRWHKFNPDSVYYDDICREIEANIKQHNRIVLILQGLLDRSPVFHPHPPWELWTDAGFRAALELVYDESRVLPAGEKPDFEAYRQRLNETPTTGSVTIGQQDAWELYQKGKESERRAADWRHTGGWYPDRFSPFGNPGPGIVARIAKFGKRSRKATFSWNRERQDWRGGRYGEPIRTSYTCSADKLLNVDAYTPGDFRIFFDDPRTRAEYLKWAPLLLEAEEFHAGNRKVNEPVPITKRRRRRR